MDRKPIKSEFVVWGLGREAAARIEEQLGAKVSRPSANHDLTLVDVGSASGGADKERTKLVRLLGPLVVENVLEDQDGNRLIPTGKVRVHFHKPPTPSMLTAFAERHAVGLEKQNRWQPLEADFAVKPGDVRSLPEIVKALTEDDSVETATPEVLAAFHRND